MPIELKVPAVGESVTEVEVGQWLKEVGDPVARDEVIAEIETDKATVELPAPADGVLARIIKPKGSPAKVGDVIGILAEPGEQPPPVPEVRAETQPEPIQARPLAAGTPAEPLPEPEPEPEPVEPPPAPLPDRGERVVPMSLIRRRIAARLVEAASRMALLTTFNEIDMSAVQTVRQEHRDAFERKYGVRLGLMSFFVKACVDALKASPEINAEIRGDDIVYHDYYDIGIAIGSGKGLVVPVLRDADRMSFAGVEKAIADFAEKARTNRLTVDELAGGTFTISNGGVFGSMLSTPIVNPPQSAILGLHLIEDRPVARNGRVVVRPMMYAALTYDHRLIDGREAVTFLRRIKEDIEGPSRMLVEI